MIEDSVEELKLDSEAGGIRLGSVDLETPAMRDLETELKAKGADIAEMRRRIDAFENSARALEKEDVELLCLRFLLGHKTVENAWRVFENTLKWRLENRAWEIVGEEEGGSPEKWAHFEKINPYRALLPTTRFTIDGRPFILDPIGKTIVEDLVQKCTVEEYAMFYREQTISNVRFCNKLSRETGKLVDTLIVFDLDQISLGMLKFSTYFRREIGLAEMLAPELGGVIMVINAPYFFNVLWQVVKPVLNPVTCEKIRVFGCDGSGLKFLSKLVKPEHLPMVYGGKDMSPLDKWMIQYAPRFNDVTVSAGRKQSVTFHVTKAQEIVWQARVKSRDIQFSVKFSSAAGTEAIVETCKKISASDGAVVSKFSAPNEGTLSIEFDNSYSRWYSKQCQYLFYKTD